MKQALTTLRLCLVLLCLALSIVGAASGCAEGPPAADASASGTTSDAIINGSATSAFPAVGMLLNAKAAGVISGDACTATVVSPHVLLTAAHCVLALDPSTGALQPQVANPANLSYFTGASTGSSLSAAALHAVTAVLLPDGFDPKAFVSTLLPANASAHLYNANDIALVVVADAMAAAPLPFGSRALGAGDVGSSLTLVGYGTTGSAADRGPRSRRTIDAPLSALTDAFVTTGPVPYVCNGDSGGPALLGGTIVALVSAGDAAQGRCLGNTVLVRVDPWAAFIQAAIAAYEPGAASN